MAVAISVTGDALLGYVLTVTDADQSDLVHVYRTDGTGHYPLAIVRGLDMATPTGGTMVVIDYEAPFNKDLVYTAQVYASGDLDTPVASADSNIVGTTLPFGFAILTDPLDATQRLAISVEEMDEWSYELKVLSKSQVLGRANAVISSDVESGRTGKLVCTNISQFSVDWDGLGPYLPYDVIDHANWATVFSSGRTLLFRCDHEETGYDDLYCKILSRSVSRPDRSVGRNAGAAVLKRHSLSYEEQDRPATALTGSGLGTWDVVNASNASWDEVNAKHANWFSVLVNPGL